MLVKQRCALLQMVLEKFLSLESTPSLALEHTYVNLTALLVELVSTPCNGQHVLLDSFRSTHFLQACLTRIRDSPDSFFTQHALQIVIALLKT